MTHTQTDSGYNIWGADGTLVASIQTTVTVGATDTNSPGNPWTETINAVAYDHWEIDLTGRKLLVADLNALLAEITAIHNG